MTPIETPPIDQQPEEKTSADFLERTRARIANGIRKLIQRMSGKRGILDLDLESHIPEEDDDDVPPLTYMEHHVDLMGWRPGSD